MKKRFSLAFWHRSHAGRRMAALLISTFLMGFCIAIFDQVNFGLDPCSTFSMGLSGLTGLSFGTCQFLLNLVLFIPVVLLDPSLIGIGTVANMVLVGLVLAYEQAGTTAAFWPTYAFNALTVGAGEIVACYGLGMLLLWRLEKSKALQNYLQNR